MKTAELAKAAAQMTEEANALRAIRYRYARGKCFMVSQIETAGLASAISCCCVSILMKKVHDIFYVKTGYICVLGILTKLVKTKRFWPHHRPCA